MGSLGTFNLTAQAEPGTEMMGFLRLMQVYSSFPPSLPFLDSPPPLSLLSRAWGICGLLEIIDQNTECY